MGQVENSIISLGVFYDKMRAWFGQMGVTVSGGLQGVLTASAQAEQQYDAAWKQSGAMAAGAGGSWLHPLPGREGKATVASGVTVVSIVVPQSGQAEWRTSGKAIGDCVASADVRHWTLRLKDVKVGDKLAIKGGGLLTTTDADGYVAITEAGEYAVCGEGGMVVVTKVSQSNA